MAGFDYTSYDYEALVAEITRLISEKGEWNDIYDSSTSQTLIQLLAATTDQLHYMLERRSRENFLPTAVLPTSVRAIANSVGYRSRRKTSSTGTLQLTLVDDNGNPIQSEGNVTIPKYTKVTFNNTNFVTSADQTLPSTTVYPITFSVLEGEETTLTYDTTDVDSTIYKFNYVEIVDYAEIEESSLVITTDTQTFTDVNEAIGDTPALDSIEFASSTDQAYDIRFTNEGMRIIFGDGVRGEKPVGTLTVKYIKSSGEEIDIQTTGLTFAFESDTLTDDVIVIPANEYKYTLTNTTAINGGLDEESNNDIKKFSPSFIKSASRAVTRQDYEFWVKRSAIGGIVDVGVYGENDIGITIYNMNNVYITYLTNVGDELTTLEQQALRDYMENFKTITTHLVLTPAELIPLELTLTVNRNNNLSISNSEMYDYVNNSLKDYFEIAEGSLGKDHFYSDLVCLLNNLTITRDGVTKSIANYVDLSVKALKEFSTPLVTQTTTATITYGIDGDSYTIEINGTPYTYVSVPTNDADAVATALAALVNADVNVSASAVTNVITITTATVGTTFTINNTGTTTLLNNRIDVPVQLPTALLDNVDLVQQILPSSVELVRSDNVVLATDDGAGNIYNGTVDYVTGLVTIPILADGTYYIRYSQNNDQNFEANSKSAITYSEPKAAYTDVTELFTSIEIV